MAFRLERYIRLLIGLKASGYQTATIAEHFKGSHSDPNEVPCIYLRHDVDRFPQRAEALAHAEVQIGVRSTYYFRCNTRGRFPDQSIRQLHRLGHEIGFHYECLARTVGNRELAFKRFRSELATLRQIAPVKTVCAHGSPLSQFGGATPINSSLYEQLELLGDAGESIDFKEILYISDTGGRFGSRYNLRDYVKGRNFQAAASPERLKMLLNPAQEPRIVLNTHPERWPSSWLGLYQARCSDWGANQTKRVLKRARSSHTPISPI